MKTSEFTDFDTFLFKEGTHEALYEKLGAHLITVNGREGVRFLLWAPHAKEVFVKSNGGEWRMFLNREGLWEAFTDKVKEGDVYLYSVHGADGVWRTKADPFAFCSEVRPSYGSVVRDISRYYTWQSDACFPYDPMRPLAVYEVHLGSWRQDGGRFLNYRQIAEPLAGYVASLGYTHVELIGICEYPFDPSWGYQVTGYFAPTSRYGSPEDFMYFVDTMHRYGLGVILDFVPAHTPKDSWGLTRFDGTYLYEYEDPLRREFPDWGTCAFDHGKGEVRSFLLSSAFFFIREYRVDGIRIDAVASMLHNNFCRGQWAKNRYGGDENLEGIAFLKDFNRLIARDSRAFTVGEDSSIMRDVTLPVEQGGLGFALKWSLGWMNDTLKYMELDPVYRGSCHDRITGLTNWCFEENFMLVLSHDEVVHLKHSMLMKMPGALQDKFGCLRSLYTFFFTFPGKKLLFMGQEFAVRDEWNEACSLDWGLMNEPGSHATLETVRKLLSLYKSRPVLYEDPPRDRHVFEWVNRGDGFRSTFSFLRKPREGNAGAMLTVLSFAPLEHEWYDVGVPEGGTWHRVFSTYDSVSGENRGYEYVQAYPDPCDGYPFRLTFKMRAYESVIYEKC